MKLVLVLFQNQKDIHNSADYRGKSSADNSGIFRKEFWFEPELIIDYLALIWDHADNIKWVTWIWPKKALSLVQNYWTVENIYEHLDEFTPDLRDKLKNDSIEQLKCVFKCFEEANVCTKAKEC